jgi:nucleotide-binding universal stress UspA family protein
MSAIVVGTDGSDGARAAVHEAGRLAGALGEKVIVVSAYAPSTHVASLVPDALVYAGDGRTAAEEALRLATAELQAAGVECDTRAVHGSPAEAIVDVAKVEQASHIVVGSRGMRGAGRFLGSVPNTVSHKAPCSVVIVRTD